MNILEKMAELHAEGKAFAVATVIRAEGSVPRHEGSKMLIYPNGAIAGTIGGGDLEHRVIQEAMEAIETGETRILEYAFRDVEEGDVGVCGGEMEVFVEPVKPRPTIVVVGGGHVGRSVTHLAHWLGFRVVVSDDRPEFATAEAAPDADEYIACALADLPDKVSINNQTYIMLTTRGVTVDVEGLPKILETPAAYIGIIGSRRRWEVTVKELQDRGIAAELLSRVTSPMGLELNAETPEEIALSMLAEIVMLRRKGTGQPMAHAPVERTQAKP
jgi:xanthine dehydrogenase accessory factor